MHSIGRSILISSLLGAVVLSVGCATGSQSLGAAPVLYPNAAMNRMGDAAAKAEVAACVQKAQAAGLSPAAQNNAAGQGAARGGAMAGVAGVVGGLVSGRGLESSVLQGVSTAAVGAAAGAVGGAMQSQPNTTYRQFVQRCVSEKGLDVIGWN
jgi:hypothetical protein